MNRKAAVVLLAGMLFACAPMSPASAPPPAAVAPPPTPASVSGASGPQMVTIRRLSCARLLSAAEDDRASGSMFYLGYEASRLGIRAIDVSGVESMETLALSYCASNPDRPAAEAFARAYQVLGR